MVFRKWDFSPIDKSNGGTEVPLPNNIEKFLANDTKVFEARKELFEKA